MLFVVAMQVTQENRHGSATDYINMPTNEAIYFNPYPTTSPPSPAFWNSDTGWWAYYYPTPAYSAYDFPFNPCYPYHYPQYYCADNDFNSIASNQYPILLTQYPNNNCLHESNDHHPVNCSGPESFSSMNSTYSGSHWGHETSVTPTSCTTVTTNSDKFLEDQTCASSSPISSRSSKDDSQNDGENCYILNNVNTSSTSSESSKDSENYIIYSRGINPVNLLKKNITQTIEDKFKDQDRKNNNLIHQEKESLSNKYKHDNEKANDHIDIDNLELEMEEVENNQYNDEENTTVTVSLPLKLQFYVSEGNEDITTVIVGDSRITTDIDTCVDFTLKQPSQIKNKEESHKESIEQISDEAITEDAKSDTSEEISETKTIITDDAVDNATNNKQSNSTEKDSIENNVVPVINQVEINVDRNVKKLTTRETKKDTKELDISRKIPKFQRTQTHSRLFKLLNETNFLTEEQLKLENRSLDNKGESLVENKRSLPIRSHKTLPRPKSLDCENLVKKYNSDSTNETLKSYAHIRRHSQVLSNSKQSLIPRSNVFCPRTKNPKSLTHTYDSKSAMSPLKVLSSEDIPQ